MVSTLLIDVGRIVYSPIFFCVNSIGFGLSSYGKQEKCIVTSSSTRLTYYFLMLAIAPAFFQFASEIFYPISEIIPTGYLFTVGNIGGVFLVAVMGWSENMLVAFPMRIPMLCLSISMFLSVYFMIQVKGNLKRTSHRQSHLP